MNKMSGFFIPYAVHCGEDNMKIDSDLLDYAIENCLASPILRFYGWSPQCVSLGRNQSGCAVNVDYCKANGIEIVRRLTGGRALLHDNELTYSFVCPVSFLENGESVIGSYKEISGALALGFKKLGIGADFPIDKKVKTKFEYCMSVSTGADLSFEGKKIVGSAQFRKQGYILQHGSIVFDYDRAKILQVFGEMPLNDGIATIKSINEKITREMLADAIKDGFTEYFSIRLLSQNEESLPHPNRYV